MLAQNRCSVKQQGGGAEQHKQPACHGPGYAVAKLPEGGGVQKKRGRLRCGRAGRRSRRFGICGAAGGAALPHTAVFGGSKSVICAPGHLRREGMAALAAKACLTDIFRRTKRACFHKLYYLSGYRIAFGFQRCREKMKEFAAQRRENCLSDLYYITCCAFLQEGI